MKMTFAALAAVLAYAATSLGGTSASAQQPTRSAQQPTRAAPMPRAAPVYRVELVVFRATRTIGTPEDWALEAGTAPAKSTDADPAASGEPAQSGAASAGAAHGGTGQTQSGNEQSSSGQTAPAPTGNRESRPALPSNVVRLLATTDFELDGVVARLRASGRYVPIAHIAWAQTASPWGRPVQIPIQSLGLDTQGITGTVALERGEFLHLVLDLRYAMADPPAGLDAPPGTVFVLDQSHRVRLRERNYFDHPAFGVIALVTSDMPERLTPSPGAVRP